MKRNPQDEIWCKGGRACQEARWLWIKTFFFTPKVIISHIIRSIAEIKQQKLAEVFSMKWQLRRRGHIVLESLSVQGLHEARRIWTREGFNVSLLHQTQRTLYIHTISNGAWTDSRVILQIVMTCICVSKNNLGFCQACKISIWRFP